MLRAPRAGLLVSIATVVFLVACSGGDSVRHASRGGEGATAVHSGAGGTRSSRPGVLFAARGAGNARGNRLALVTGAVPLTWITDRPDRTAGHISPAEFVAGWSAAGFDSDPPNAILLAADRSYTVELTEPEWDAPNATLSFTLVALPVELLPIGDLGAAELFIDDADAGYASAHQIASTPRSQFVR
jgi:hypothetical protein